MHDPVAKRFRVLPLTEQIPVVPLYVTERPEEVVAVSVSEAPVPPDNACAQVMLWEPFDTVSVFGTLVAAR